MLVLLGVSLDLGNGLLNVDVEFLAPFLGDFEELAGGVAVLLEVIKDGYLRVERNDRRFEVVDLHLFLGNAVEQFLGH